MHGGVHTPSQSVTAFTAPSLQLCVTAAAATAALRLRAEVSEVEERKGDHIRQLLGQQEQVCSVHRHP